VNRPVALPADCGPGASRVHQQRVDAFFETTAGYWRAIYGEDRRLESTIYRERHARILSLASGLVAEAPSRVLEVGCGAGLVAVALAERGCRVTAMDASPTMISMTRERAAAAGVAARLAARVGDVHALDLPDRCVDLVLAVGLLPWLHSPDRALTEMARVLRPGGHLLLTADNRGRLSNLLDPRRSPWLAPARQGLKKLLQACGWRLPRSGSLDVRMHTICEIDALLASAGLRKLKGLTVGFGPFSMFSRPVLSDRRGVWLQRRLQPLADRGLPGLRTTGSHYVVLARKPLACEAAA